jgi:tetratricopeptide (TPR) repeat protein
MVVLQHNEIDEALDLFESALKSHREKYGQVHHLVGSALHNIGIVHLFAGRYNVAQKYFQEAASVRSSALGSEHPDVAVSS